MAFLLGGANSATGYDIENSAMFNGDSSVMSRTPSSEGNRRIWTFSGWFKRCKMAHRGMLFTVIPSSASDTNKLMILFHQNDNLEVGLNSKNILNTNMLFRDPTAWYHIVAAADTTDGTAANRFKLYINGVQNTSWSTTNLPSEDDDLGINQSGELHTIGEQADGSNPFDGYMSEVHFIDGTQHAASSFGEFDEDSGIWKPKKYTGSYGTNGFFLEFQQTGSSANASGFGADTSGNGNHLGINGFGTFQVTSDTPTNNFCTLSSIGPGLTTSSASVANESLSVGNTGLTGYDGSSTVESTMAVANGKWYVEYKLTDVQNAQMGITGGINKTDDYLGNSAYGYGYISSNATAGDTGIYNNNSLINIFRDGNQTDGEIHMLAFDLDNNKLWIGQNGTWKNSSDPTDSSGGGGQSITAATSTDAGFYSVGFRNGSADSATSYINFGCPAYTNASSQSDANGYGDFEFSPPSGYYALCTKNIAKYG